MIVGPEMAIRGTIEGDCDLTVRGRGAARAAARSGAAGSPSARHPEAGGAGARAAQAAFMSDERTRLLELMRRLSYEEREVVLASGRRSNFYLDCKQTVLTAEGHF